MKARHCIILLGLVSLGLFSSCLKDDKETILVHDPQIIPFITDTLWPADLLELFGEENVNFGDLPPQLDCEFRSNHQYVATNLDPYESPSIGSITPIIHFHKFRNQYLQICEYCSKNSAESKPHIVDSAYITGHDNKFTVYYREQWSTGGTPTLAVIMSGELSEAGIINYRYGYKIVAYADSIVPSNVYPLNTIFIFQDPDHLSEYDNWFK